jgi:hypothetical protein
MSLESDFHALEQFVIQGGNAASWFCEFLKIHTSEESLPVP